MLVYDLEIIKAVPTREPRIPDIEYCAGWHDHANMGISVLCAYDYDSDRYRVFCGDNLFVFADLCREHDVLVSYNGISFDNKILASYGIDLPAAHCYDLLREIFRGENLPEEYNCSTHTGYSLDSVCQENFGMSKSDDGALAPVKFQRGEIGSVIDYCLNDVKLTKAVNDRVCQCGALLNPKFPGSKIYVRRPGC